MCVETCVEVLKSAGSGSLNVMFQALLPNGSLCDLILRTPTAKSGCTYGAAWGAAMGSPFQGLVQSIRPSPQLWVPDVSQSTRPSVRAFLPQTVRTTCMRLTFPSQPLFAMRHGYIPSTSPVTGETNDEHTKYQLATAPRSKLFSDSKLATTWRLRIRHDNLGQW
ncbi:hypothetical protein BDV95DRAFT_381041 [Massariosphaeria phaeospora]|uniref:Uncharacterized protein n=1 Tax=Massariosphaeria phaeospora TaxID=100035 RepID=A0A7C8MQ22_9PLEO|nr:hypothetical protein BDV95DRAFT_381041 [Massariosphaeria phaeospora]